ncbi:MAG: DUF58 domain-containing protein [Spirochaetes bacterium]|nr:DUF58 domain-containing protein [Spirochaetota bacterium]
MISNEILKKVKKIEIITSRLVNDIFAGEYHSIFKGQGMEFSEVRDYTIGDDIRTIDWNVSARMGSLYVKKYVEERELTVILLIDMSSSSKFGTVNSMKSEIAAEISALLAFSAIKNNDKVGVIIFTDKIEKYIPPKKGRMHTLRIIREILSFEPEHTNTDLNIALDYLNKVIKRKAIVFILSDFISPDYSRSLATSNKRHDVIALSLTDPKEKEIGQSGFLYLEDAETGEELIVETSNPLFRKKFASETQKKSMERIKMFNSINLDHIEILTDRSYITSLVSFFKERMKKLR